MKVDEYGTYVSFVKFNDENYSHHTKTIPLNILTYQKFLQCYFEEGFTCIDVEEYNNGEERFIPSRTLRHYQFKAVRERPLVSGWHELTSWEKIEAHFLMYFIDFVEFFLTPSGEELRATRWIRNKFLFRKWT